MEQFFIEKYIDAKNQYSVKVSSKLESFMVKENGEEGLKRYRSLVKANIPSQNLFSVNIPWILADLSGVDPKECIDIASAWEAIVLYVRQLDHISDNNSLTNDDKKNMLTSSMLFAYGLDSLKDIIGPTSTATFSSLYEAAKYQAFDMNAMDKGSDMTIEDHLKIMKGKNIFTKMIAQFYVDNSKISTESINSFIDNLATFAQIIDDIKDIDEDMATNSYSHLLFDLRTHGYNLKDRTSVMLGLIRTGILTRSLELAENFLKECIKIGTNLMSGDNSAPGQRNLLMYLECQLADVRYLIMEINEINERGTYDKEVEEYIKSSINTLCMSS